MTEHLFTNATSSINCKDNPSLLMKPFPSFSKFQSSGGVQSILIGDGMTRGPVVRVPSAQDAG